MGSGLWAHYQFSVVIYTVFKNKERESYKEGINLLGS